MPKRPSASNVDRAIDRELPQAAVVEDDDNVPSYRVDKESKIPVSKSFGKMLKDSLDSARSLRKTHVDSWDEAVRYYNNNQMPHRTSEDDRSSNRYFAQRRNTQWTETENIVYSNAVATLPAVYAKNPRGQFTIAGGALGNDRRTAMVDAIESTVNVLAGLPHSPGLNLKSHVTRGVLAVELCNLAWMEVGYTLRENSVEQARADIERISKQLADAKDVKTARELEGQLAALEETCDVLAPSGPYVKYHAPHNIIPDGNANSADFCDAKRLFIETWFPTAYLQARYGEKTEDGTWVTVYNPTHVISSEGNDINDTSAFKLIKEQDPTSQSNRINYMGGDARRYYTKCWRVLDKATRRVYLYADNNWKFPIWVENDPYGLPDFFNFYPVNYNTTPLGAYAHSSTTYYLDQQDSLNEIHDEWRRARMDSKENILYDNMLNRDSMIAWLKGSTPNAVGVDVPQGKTFKDMIIEKPNLFLKAGPLYDPERVLRSIDRISGVSDVLRGAQFKTNTTNKAIENYNSSTALRVDAKIDAIEDWLGKIFYAVGFMCAQFMERDQVAALIGAERAEAWERVDAATLRTMYTCRVVGGSTQKPTSQMKKGEALELGKILAQFAQFAPATVIGTTLRLMNNAFDEIDLPAGTFENIAREAEAAMQRGNSTQGAPNAGGPPRDGAGPPSGGSGGSGPTAPPGAGGDPLARIAQLVDSLPPPAKMALGQAIAQGVPVTEALAQIVQAVQGGGNSGPPN